MYNKNINYEVVYPQLFSEYIPNVGRESHSHFHHIVKYYDNLSDKTVFIQTDPFLQQPYILFALDNIEKLKSV